MSDLQSSSLSAGSCPPQLGSVSGWGVSGGSMNRPTVQVSLHFAPCKLVVALFSEVLPLFWLISLPVRELPSMWKAFLFHSSLTGAQHPSQFPSLFFKNHPFYLFLFTYLMSVLGLCCRMNFFSNCSLQASHCGGFSCWRVEHRL